MQWPSPIAFPGPTQFPERSGRQVFVVEVDENATQVVEGQGEMLARTVRNAGSHVVTLSRDSGMAAGGGYDLAAGKEVVVWLEAGASLWGICPTGQTSKLEVI
jgi:hypothetical protein